jgi:hypothetical protein
MMTTGARLARLNARYQWNGAGGPWAALHRWSADMPGCRYVSSESVTANPRLSICYLGFAEGERYILPYLREQQEKIGGAVTVVGQPPVTWRSMVGSPLESRSDILLLGCSSRRAARLADDRSLILPFRVHLTLDVIPDPEAMLRQVSSNERRQFNNLRRRSEWELEVGSDIDDMKFFHHRMHLPTMATRHGEATRSVDWETAVHCLFGHGVLFFVTEAGKRVAGVLCRYGDNGGTLYMRTMGVLDGDEQHYRSGVVKAVYYFTVEWAAKNGISRIDMSGGEPFPGKGVFQFKRRFHPTAVLPVDHFGDKRVLLRVLRDTPAVRDFLVATPMITADRAGNLTARYFRDSIRPPRAEVRVAGPGIEKSHEIDLDAFLASGATVASGAAA